MDYTENAKGALRMYGQRMEVLKREISSALLAAETGQCEEAEAVLKMDIVQKEVDEINNCLRVLKALLERQ